MNPPRAPRAAAWTTQAERSTAWVLRLMRWIAVALGRRVARVVLHPITFYFMLFGGAATRASRAYLRRVLGREPRWSERYRHLHHFASVILDRVYLLRGDFHLFDVRVTGAEHLEQVLQSGGGAFLVGAHLGSFEALRALGESRRGLRIAMLMYEQNARLMNTTLRAVAPNAQLHVIGLGRMEAMLELRDWLDAGGVAGLLADRTLQAPGQAGAGRSRTHWIRFLGEPAAFSDGAFRLAMLLRRPVVSMTGLYHGDNRYELRFAPLADFGALPADRQARDAAVEAAVPRYARLLEQLCRESPWNWFNFFDFWAGLPAGGGETRDATSDPSPLSAAAAGAADPVPGPAGPGARGGL
ncbi:MAG TPA: acyl-CoA synthetase [Ramlibacter sp.]